MGPDKYNKPSRSTIPDPPGWCNDGGAMYSTRLRVYFTSLPSHRSGSGKIRLEWKKSFTAGPGGYMQCRLYIYDSESSGNIKLQSKKSYTAGPGGYMQCRL